MMRQCLVLARANNTPVGWWLSLPLGELRDWIGAHNRLFEELQEQNE